MSTTTEPDQYEYLKIDRPLRALPITARELKGEYIYVYILLGPIGSGKSTFIELLSPDMELSIAKDTLQSATQDVTCYRVEGLSDRGGGTFVLMDTPGFMDPRLSESRITTMITKTLDRLRKSAAGVFVSIFYFHPITDIRIGGKKRQAIVLLRAFADAFGAVSINVITTMWNMFSTSQETDIADKRFEKLQEEIFQKSEKLSIQVTKMAFTTNSALSVIDILFSGWIHGQKQSKNSTTPPYHSLVRDNLWERIATVYQEWELLQEDRQYASTPGKEDTRLLEVLREKEPVVLATLTSFLDDMYRIDPMSCFSLPPQATPTDLSASPPPASTQALERASTPQQDSSLSFFKKISAPFTRAFGKR